jgi:hypothetical protein
VKDKSHLNITGKDADVAFAHQEKIALDIVSPSKPIHGNCLGTFSRN